LATILCLVCLARLVIVLNTNTSVRAAEEDGQTTLYLPSLSVTQGITGEVNAASEAAPSVAAEQSAAPAPVTDTASIASAAQVSGQHALYLPAVGAPNQQLFEEEPMEQLDQLIQAASGISYYVDCTAGNDNNAGTSAAKAWKTLAKVNEAELAPGDRLLFKRGCAWTGTLHATWNGTASQPILISAYGAGDLPRIQDPYRVSVMIYGSYKIVEYIHATMSRPPNPRADCNNQPVGWYAGFTFEHNSAYNTIRYAKASKHAIGVYFAPTSHHNKLLSSTITDNHVLWEFRQDFTLGAMGVLLHGSYNEVGYNLFKNNKTICTYGGGADSNSIEVYGARNSIIHHNSSNDRVFSEMGSHPTRIAADNTYAYNLHVSGAWPNRTGSRFIVTRGAGHPHGPVWRTKVYNNTIYQTGHNSVGVSCGYCGYDVLTLKNNILWSDHQPFWSDAPFVEANNIFWSTDGEQKLKWPGFSKNPASKMVNPQFVDPANGNFTLKPSSPAINQGLWEIRDLGFRSDLARNLIPIGVKIDVGAYEFFDVATQQIINIPGRLEAEHYRGGGQRIGYYDTTNGNIGSAPRAGDVDLEVTQDGSGTYNVGWIDANEWLAYNIHVAATGTYQVVARVATPHVDRRFHLEINGSNVSGSVTLPKTGSWQTWANVVVSIPLNAGNHTLRFVAETELFNLNYLDIRQN
jgi:hypothetical protein